MCVHVNFEACMLATGGVVQASAIGAVKALCLLFYRYGQLLSFGGEATRMHGVQSGGVV